MTKRNPEVGQVWQLKTNRGEYLFEVTLLESFDKHSNPYPMSKDRTVVHMKCLSPHYEHAATRDPWDYAHSMLESKNWSYVSDSAVANIET